MALGDRAALRAAARARAARDQAAAEVDRLRQRDAPLAAELARLDERRRAVGDEAARLEAHRTRLRETDEQLERDLRDGRARSTMRAPRSRLEVESGLADVSGRASAVRAGGRSGGGEQQTLETAEAGCAGPRQAGRTRSQARTPQGTPRQIRTGPQDLAAAQQEPSRSLPLAASARPRQILRARRWNRRCARRRRLCRLPKRRSTMPAEARGHPRRVGTGDGAAWRILRPPAHGRAGGTPGIPTTGSLGGAP